MHSTVARDHYHAQLSSSKLHSAYQLNITKSFADMSGASRELPMPIVSRITSLIQAQATLQHCLTRLVRSQGDATERRHFQQWLEQWEQAFTAYLSLHMSAMKNEEITACRILKANHLACTILASEGGPDRSSFDVFEAEFQAIVELATAILRSRQQNGTPSTDASIDSSAASGALDVRDPLRVVAARCDRSNIRAQAVHLLNSISSR